MTQFCEWFHSLLGSLSASINQLQCHSLHLTYVFLPRVCSHITLPVVFIHLLWTLQLDIHGRSHNFLFIHPREALLVGHQVTALPLFSCGIPFHSTSYRGSLAWDGLVHLSHV